MAVFLSFHFQSVCNRLGIDAGDRLHSTSKKRKFLVSSVPTIEVKHQFLTLSLQVNLHCFSINKDGY